MALAQKFEKKLKPAERGTAPAKGLRGSNPTRVRTILQKLNEAYPAATCALKHANPFQLLIATILSAQCTDERVNMVTRGRFRKYEDARGFAYANPAEVENEIRSTGCFRKKSKSISGASKATVEDSHGEVPKTVEELLT